MWHSTGRDRLYNVLWLPLTILALFVVMPLVVIVLLSNGKRNFAHLRAPGFDADRQLIAALSAYGADTTWVFTLERQLYPFLAGLRVPPEIAVTSTMRRVTGGLGTPYVLALLDTYNPEQLLLPRDQAYPPAFMQYVMDRYREHYTSDDVRHFVRMDLVAAQAKHLSRPSDSATVSMDQEEIVHP